MNKVILLGNIGSELELKHTDNGKAVVNFSLAVNKGDKVNWVRVTAWEKVAQACAEWLTKGDQVLVDGELNSRQWTTKEGENKTALEVIGSRITFIKTKRKSRSDHCDESQGKPFVPQRNDMDSIPF